MLIFYNWGGGGSIRGGGGLWHFTEFLGGILISKEFSKYYQTALPTPPTPSPLRPLPPPPFAHSPLRPLPLPPSPSPFPPYHIS